MVEPLSPELALIDPELAERARAQLGDPGELVSRPSPVRKAQRPTRGGSAGRPRVALGRISDAAVVVMLVLAAALAAAGALWDRHDDGSSSSARSPQIATPTQPDQSLQSSTGERPDTKTTASTGGIAGARYTRKARPAAFTVPGAPKEPLDEIALPVRARRLDAWLTAGRGPTAANQRHWLYQHAWIVTGANFGWWHGAEALRLLIRVDRRIESRWGIGYGSEAVARRALTAAEARMK